MENKKIIFLAVVLIFSQIIGIPGIYKIWFAVFIGLFIVILGFKQVGFEKKDDFRSNLNKNVLEDNGEEEVSKQS